MMHDEMRRLLNGEDGQALQWSETQAVVSAMPPHRHTLKDAEILDKFAALTNRVYVLEEQYDRLRTTTLMLLIALTLLAALMGWFHA